MQRATRIPLAAALALVASTAAVDARADASSWLFVGGGPVVWKQGTAPVTTSGALSIDVGMGTRPDAPYVFGGLFRMTPMFGSGTDVALLARAATRSFQEARFGVALDAGAYQRFWGAGSTGFTGGVAVGFPLAFTLSLQAQVGTDDARAFSAVAGLDVLRLTVYRKSLTSFWTNPSVGPRQAP